MPLTTRHRLQAELKNVDYFVIDESSMCGLRMVQLLDSRLRAIFESTELFGGKNMILVGDIHQIPPVRDIPTYQKFLNYDFLTEIQQAGYISWKQFYGNSSKVVLEKSMRQSEEKYPEFCQFLENYKTQKIT
jgi:hypothetical protein